MGYLMTILFSTDIKEKYDCVHSELAGSFTCLCSRKMENGWWWEGEEREREHAVSNADTNNACFNKTIDLLLSTRKEKTREEKRI
jgi:hypothetical protein